MLEGRYDTSFLKTPRRLYVSGRPEAFVELDGTTNPTAAARALKIIQASGLVSSPLATVHEPTTDTWLTCAVVPKSADVEKAVPKSALTAVDDFMQGVRVSLVGGTLPLSPHYKAGFLAGLALTPRPTQAEIDSGAQLI